jgi:hypothetical protein
LIETFTYLTSAKARSTKLSSSRATVTKNIVLQNWEISYLLHINENIPFVWSFVCRCNSLIFSFWRCTVVQQMLGKIRLSMGVHVSFQKRKYFYKDHINLLSYRISYSLLQIVKTTTSLNDTSRKFTCKLLSL